jgi:hypothetical protein
MSDRILVVRIFLESAHSGGAQTGKRLTQGFSCNAIFSDELNAVRGSGSVPEWPGLTFRRGPVCRNSPSLEIGSNAKEEARVGFQLTPNLSDNGASCSIQAL